MTATVFGVYAGLLGCEHGFFEALQGNTAPASIRIMAIRGPGLPFPFGHEPAMTIVPNFLATGVLAMLFGLAIIACSLTSLRGKRGAIILSLLSILLLLSGGGFGPISLLITAVIAAYRTGTRSTVWRALIPAAATRWLARLWPWAFGAALCWVPIELILGWIFHLKNDPRQVSANLNLLFSYPLLAFFALTLLAGFADKASTFVTGAEAW